MLVIESRCSPNGRWVAYHSPESPRPDVHVRPFVRPAWRALRRAWLASRFRRLMNGNPEAKTSLRAADRSRVVVGV